MRYADDAVLAHVTFWAEANIISGIGRGCNLQFFWLVVYFQFLGFLLACLTVCSDKVEDNEKGDQ